MKPIQPALAGRETDRVNAVKIVSTQVEGDDMLRMVALALGVPTEHAEKAQLLSRIEAQIADLKTKLQLVLDRLRSHNLFSAA